MAQPKARTMLVALWVCVVTAGLWSWGVHRDALPRSLAAAFSLSTVAGYGLYLLLGCVRGFTLVPSTALVVAAVAFLAPAPLFVLTLLGILVSSASIYRFSEAWHLRGVFERRHPERIARLRSVLQRHELSVIVAWSFFPLAPTDLIVYVCGILEIDLTTCLLGVGLGEGAICGVYIFAGDYLLRLIGWK